MTTYEFKSENERNYFAILAADGIKGFVAATGNTIMSTAMLNRWIAKGIVEVVEPKPGKPVKSVRLMNATEKAAWNTYLDECFNATQYVCKL